MAARGARKKQRTLTGDLSALLKRLVEDLRARVEKVPTIKATLAARHTAERAAQRTADTFEEFRDRTLEQVGAAWILSCVFVRTLEDRGHLPQRRLAGEGAQDSESLFFELAPSLTTRDYLYTVFREVARLPGADAVLGLAQNPAWRLGPSEEMTRALLAFFREEKEDGTLEWTFPPDAGTRFLGDLYQDLSEDVRKRYALLQTPVFVEEFIIDLTLEPAIKEFGLEAVRLIDPTCGSGHFLLGAFERLVEARLKKAPAVPVKEHAGAALRQVYGVDVNAYAVAITRFRLMLAYVEKCGIKLGEAPAKEMRLEQQVVVADSLLHGAKGEQTRLSDAAGTAEARRLFRDELWNLEDAAASRVVFGQRYHAVVGNPPYITCADEELRGRYRKIFPNTCHGTFQLVAPFLERFFQLALETGFVGTIVGNGFIKREFGRPLVEKVLAYLDVQRVIDTSGAFIPGHGTPTLILMGRNRAPVSGSVSAVLGKRGEPSTPEDPSNGLVWRSIRDHLSEEGFDDEYITITTLQRTTLARHPWSLGGGGAAQLKEYLENRTATTLADACVPPIGRAARTGEDDAYQLPGDAMERHGVPRDWRRGLLVGEAVRDWSVGAIDECIYPYAEPELDVRDLTRRGPVDRFLWPLRARLADRATFQGKMKDAGRRWYEYMQYTSSANRTAVSIAFAFVATHNHFVLDRGGRVFKQSAPIIKLKPDATEDEHLALVAYLNTSTACFFLKQAMMNKGGSGIGRGVQDETWESRFEFDGAKVSSLPVPDLNEDLRRVAAALEQLARERAAMMPAARLSRAEVGETIRIKTDLASAKRREADVLARMVSLQEELDWSVYELFGLLAPWDLSLLRSTRDVVFPNFPVNIDTTSAAVLRQGLHPGHRAFEIVMVRELLVTGEKTAWFERNGYRAPSEASGCYAPACQRLLEARVAIIDRNPQIRLLERPEYKRRWTVRDYDAEVRSAAAESLLATAEKLAASATAIAPARALARELLRDAKVRAVADLIYSAGADAESELVSLLGTDAVPYLAALRYTPDGLEKRALWERVWDLQRREDAGEKLEIQPPPKYDSKDYRHAASWRHRGKLDVPKERFISYPGAEREGDPSPIIGWAGWNHAERAQALADLIVERRKDDWDRERLTPLLAGLQELMPWLVQYHNEVDRKHGDKPAETFGAFLAEEMRQLRLSVDDLRNWRPPEKRARSVAVKKMSRPAPEEPSTGPPPVAAKRSRRPRKAVAAEETES